MNKDWAEHCKMNDQGNKIHCR